MLMDSSETGESAIPEFAPTPAIMSRVSYRQTVARELTHKRYLENVYVTSLDRLSATEFLGGAYLPRANTYINAMRGDSNEVTLPIIEIGRQIAMAITHQFLGVGHCNAFILSDIQFEIFPAQHAIDWQAQETLLAHSVLTDSQHLDSGELSQVNGYMNFYVDAQRVFRQSSNYAIQSHARYLKMRELMRTRYERSKKLNGGAATDFGDVIKAALCRKCTVLDDTVWIGADSNNVIATLQVDRSNLFFFDHDNDHVPGMLLLEGMRQLTGDVCARFSHDNAEKIAKINLEFSNFAELDAPVYLAATVERNPADARILSAVSIEARQLNKVVGKGAFHLSR